MQGREGIALHPLALQRVEDLDRYLELHRLVDDLDHLLDVLGVLGVALEVEPTRVVDRPVLRGGGDAELHAELSFGV